MCGRCGYSVTGLTTFSCPECGADLRDVGIIPAAKRRTTPDALTPAPGASVTKTVTIMLTDMKGYAARAAESSREDAITLLRRQRDMVQPLVQRRGGRIVKTTGDGLITVFESATDALLAAAEIQTAIQTHNRQSFKDDDQFQLRIAVSTGEVALLDNDAFGDPVNLASRVQQLAQPGEVYFTESTYHAMNHREINCDQLPAVEVKGFTNQIKLYRVHSRPT
jgi:class 3 adenylate cyclase